MSTPMPNYPTIPHDDRCELRVGGFHGARGKVPRARCHCAVRETGWVLTEVHELLATKTSPPTAEWLARAEAYATRKLALLTYIKAQL